MSLKWIEIKIFYLELLLDGALDERIRKKISNKIRCQREKLDQINRDSF